MKKTWTNPAVENVDLKGTAYNINEHDEHDEQYMDIIGGYAWECDHCS